MTKLQQLKNDIAEMQSVINDKETPKAVKESIQPSLDKAKAILKDLEAMDKKPTAKSTKTATAKTTKSKKEITSNIDALLAKVKTNPKLKAHYAGTRKSNIVKDAERQALKPGKRISADGNVYYENRANRTDIGKRLGDGGGVDNVKVGDIVRINKDAVDKINFAEWFDKDLEVTDVDNVFGTNMYRTQVAGTVYVLPYLLSQKQIMLPNKFSNGGYMPNNYANKTPQQVWDMWTVKQREHFLEDHNNQLSVAHRIKKSQIEEMVNWDFDRLGPMPETWLEKHISEGQYAKGGSINSDIAKKIAIKFSQALRMDIDAEDMAEINKRNASKEYQDGSCATHDFVDANVYAAEAFESVTGREFNYINPKTEQVNDKDVELFNKAWEIAKLNQFDTNKIKKYNVYALGGSIPAHFNTSKNIKIFNYQTQNFDNSIELVTAFTKAQQHIEDEYKNTNASTFILYSNSLENFAKKVDDILGIEKQIVEKTVENACHKTVELLQECGVFNYKSGLQISMAEITHLLMPHIATINEFAMLEEIIFYQGGSTKIVARGNAVMAINVDTGEVTKKVFALHDDDKIENIAWNLAYEYNLTDKPIEPINPQLELGLYGDLYKVKYWEYNNGKREDELHTKELYANSDADAEEKFEEMMLPKLINEDYEVSEIKKIMAKGGNVQKQKYNVGDFVAYETGDVEIEKWVAVVTKVVDLDNEFAYRVDAYTTNLSNPMKVLSKHNEKYQVQLKPSNKVIFESAKTRYESRNKMAKGGTTFKQKQTAIAKNLEGKKVPKKYQKTAGKKYNHKEEMAAAAKIAGSITAKMKKK